MKRLLTFLCAAFVWGVAASQPGAPALRFDPDGKFRIAQFTDTHLDPSTPGRAAQGEKTFARLSRVLRTERPDLIVFSGDVVTGAPAEGVWRRLLDTLDRHAVPFCVVLGNHDAEQDLSRQQIASLVCSSPVSLNERNADGELADGELAIAGRSGSEPAALVYCLDSHDYSPIEGVEGYGWFTPGQVAWLRRCAAGRAAANDGRMQPALAFFHIVLPEYLAAWRNPANTHIGRAAEEECPGALNTGMFAAMVESGGVMGVFVGHDHDIDYVVAEKGIALGYGRFSGDDTTYNNLRPGVRMILLTEGQRGFESWIREDDGRAVDRVRFDGEKLIHL